MKLPQNDQKLPKNSKNNQNFLETSFSEIIDHLLQQSIFNYLGNYFHEKYFTSNHYIGNYFQQKIIEGRFLCQCF